MQQFFSGARHEPSARSIDDKCFDAPPIRRREGVLGGAACIRDTRIPVSVLVDLRAQGRSAEQLLGDVPGLTRADLDAAWAYYRDHQDEIDQLIVAEAREE